MIGEDHTHGHSQHFAQDVIFTALVLSTKERQNAGKAHLGPVLGRIMGMPLQLVDDSTKYQACCCRSARAILQQNRLVSKKQCCPRYRGTKVQWGLMWQGLQAHCWEEISPFGQCHRHLPWYKYRDIPGHDRPVQPIESELPRSWIADSPSPNSMEREILY